MEPAEVKDCIICKQPLKETEGEVCHDCENKYHLYVDEPTFGKIRKKKREE